MIAGSALKFRKIDGRHEQHRPTNTSCILFLLKIEKYSRRSKDKMRNVRGGRVLIAPVRNARQGKSSSFLPLGSNFVIARL